MQFCSGCLSGCSNADNKHTPDNAAQAQFATHVMHMQAL